MKLRRLCLWLMLLVLFSWTLTGRFQPLTLSQTHDNGPRVQQRFIPLAFRYAAEIKAKIRESHSNSFLADDDADQEVPAAAFDSVFHETSQALSGIELRFRYMSLRL